MVTRQSGWGRTSIRFPKSRGPFPPATSGGTSCAEYAAAVSRATGWPPLSWTPDSVSVAGTVPALRSASSRATAPDPSRGSGGTALRRGWRPCLGIALRGRPRYPCLPGAAARRSVWLVPPKRAPRSVRRAVGAGRPRAVARGRSVAPWSLSSVRVARGARPAAHPGDGLPGLLAATHEAESLLPVGACVVVRADPTGSRSAPARRPPPRRSGPQRSIGVKDLLRVPHGVRGPAQSVPQHAQRLARAVARRAPLQVGAEAPALPGARPGGLGGGPPEPGVATPATADADLGAGRLQGWREQPGIGIKPSYPGAKALEGCGKSEASSCSC